MKARSYTAFRPPVIPILRGFPPGSLGGVVRDKFPVRSKPYLGRIHWTNDQISLPDSCCTSKSKFMSRKKCCMFPPLSECIVLANSKCDLVTTLYICLCNGLHSTCNVDSYTCPRFVCAVYMTSVLYYCVYMWKCAQKFCTQWECAHSFTVHSKSLLIAFSSDYESFWPP